MDVVDSISESTTTSGSSSQEIPQQSIAIQLLEQDLVQAGTASISSPRFLEAGEYEPQPVAITVLVNQEWEWLVCSEPFIWDCGWALATITCESRGNPNAIGSELYNGNVIVFRGLFQVLNGPTDPYQNAVEAHIKYWQWQRGEVPRPWPNCP